MGILNRNQHFLLILDNLTANYFKPSYMLSLTCAEDAPESLDVVLLVAAEDPLDLPPADMQI